MKVARDGLRARVWSASKTAYVINPATATPALALRVIAWNAARKAAKAANGEAAATGIANGRRTDSAKY